MNSAEDLQQSELIQEETDADNQFPTADSNANLSDTPAQHRGAIPKTKPPAKPKGPKKAVKINNNLEDAASINCNLKNNVLSCNGISNGYIDSCKSSPNETKLLGEDGSAFEDASDSPNCSSCAAGDQLQESCLQEPSIQEPSTSLCERFGKLEETEASADVPEVNPSRDNLVLDLEASDSSTEDDLLSISDDGCIYTYKGDQMADLPSSFFSLDIPLPDIPEGAGPNRQQSSSPEMDFLEMDFDPGPMGDGDSECGDFQNSESFSDRPTNDLDNPSSQINSVYPSISNSDFSLPGPSTSRLSTAVNGLNGSKREVPKSYVGGSLTKKEAYAAKVENDTMPWSCPMSGRTTGTSYYRSSKRFHSQKGELISPNEKFPSDYIKISKPPYYTVYKSDEEWQKDVGESAMIWSENEAILRQFTQIGPSACGATAVLNVLTALRFPIPPVDKLQEFVTTRLRANTSPLTEYLLSRSVAGTTHEDLIEGLQKLSDGKIYARFFPMYPERIVNLECWLAYWITNGAVPVATLNLQKCSGNIPDAWHHQMIFGVSPKGLFLTNPLECVDPSKLWSQLCSESALLVRRDDVLSRWNFKTDLPLLMKIMDVRWRSLNVVGQVANLIHEHRRELRPGFINTSHVKIPAAYESGITLAVTVDSSAYSFLRQCPELPLLHPFEISMFSGYITLSDAVLKLSYKWKI